MNDEIVPDASSQAGFFRALRITCGIVAGVVGPYLLWRLYDQMSNSMVKQYGGNWIVYIVDFVLAAITILCLWVAVGINSPKSRARLRYVALGGGVLGAIGFAGGFFGPMILAHDANQGPLMGILVTGPIGFLVGGVGGYIYALIRGQESVSR